MAIERMNPMEQMVIEQLPEEVQQTLEVELPEDLNVQGEMTSAFEVDPMGNVVPLFEQEEMIATEHQVNLAEILDPSSLNTLSSELLDAFDQDKESRKDWLDVFTKGLDLLGIKTEEREEPFPGATGVHHPLLSESVTQFQAQVKNFYRVVVQ
jgi:hypothetical protein